MNNDSWLAAFVKWRVDELITANSSCTCTFRSWFIKHSRETIWNITRYEGAVANQNTSRIYMYVHSPWNSYLFQWPSRPVIYSFPRDLFTRVPTRHERETCCDPACGRITKRLNLPRNMLQLSVILYKPV